MQNFFEDNAIFARLLRKNILLHFGHYVSIIKYIKGVVGYFCGFGVNVMESNLKNELIENFDKIHTTELGIFRIKKNLSLQNEDAVDFCKDIIKNSCSEVLKNGKNYYITLKDVIVTINSRSFTIITAHRKK